MLQLRKDYIYGMIVSNRCNQHSTGVCSSRRIKPTLL